MKAIVLFWLFFTLAAAKRGGGTIDRIWKNKKVQCERVDCGSMIPDEAMNCVNNCTSPLCYQEVYGDSPLEDGEVDERRNRLYTSCLRRKTTSMRKEQAMNGNKDDQMN